MMSHFLFGLYGNHHISSAHAAAILHFFWLNEWLDLFNVFFSVLIRDSALIPIPPTICPDCMPHNKGWSFHLETGGGTAGQVEAPAS
jgi:hypothetical protein